MAAIKFTNEAQRHAYVALARFNNSFSNIAANLDGLEKDKVFDAEAIRVFRGYTKELQSLLNCRMLSTLSAIEQKQAFEHGKVRIEREHYLNSERPAFRQRRKRK